LRAPVGQVDIAAAHGRRRAIRASSTKPHRNRFLDGNIPPDATNTFTRFHRFV
jgi:hypothetical protein